MLLGLESDCGRRWPPRRSRRRFPRFRVGTCTSRGSGCLRTNFGRRFTLRLAPLTIERHPYGLKRLIFLGCQLRRILFQILYDGALDNFIGCAHFGRSRGRIRFQRSQLLFNLGKLSRTQIGIRLQRLQKRLRVHHPRAHQQTFYHRTRPRYRKLVQRLFLYRRILRQRRQQTSPQILRRNEIPQHLGAGLWIGRCRHTGLFIPTGQR